MAVMNEASCIVFVGEAAVLDIAHFQVEQSSDSKSYMPIEVEGDLRVSGNQQRQDLEPTVQCRWHGNDANRLQEAQNSRMILYDSVWTLREHDKPMVNLNLFLPLNVF